MPRLLPAAGAELAQPRLNPETRIQAVGVPSDSRTPREKSRRQRKRAIVLRRVPPVVRECVLQQAPLADQIRPNEERRRTADVATPASWLVAANFVPSVSRMATRVNLAEAAPAGFVHRRVLLVGEASPSLSIGQCW
jgi:hypothetical protein